jgi:hypothetical protein
MTENQIRLLAERVNLRTLLFALLLGLAGLTALLYWQPVDARGYHKIGTLLREGGATTVIAVLLAVLWDFAGKRAFADEILAKANMSRDLADAGIDLVTPSFQDNRIRWDELFKNGCRLDIFVAYASTWRNTQIERINKLLSDEAGRLRVVLPNPEDQDILKALSTRFELPVEEVRRRIEGAKEFFQQNWAKSKGSVEIYFTRVVPLFSFYRFNNKVVFALYNHRTGRIPVPTFITDQGGFLFEYFTREFEAILKNGSLTERIYANRTEPPAA